MRVIIFGCRSITNSFIDLVLKNGDEIPLVVTHDEERDRIYGKTLVKEYCDTMGLENIRFDKKIDAKAIKSKNPDVVFSIYYRRIINSDILEIPSMGCINVHPAMLPKGRGPAPTMWNVLNGDEFAGSTIHYMVEGVDAGDIIDQVSIKIGNRTGFELNRDLMYSCYDLLERNYKPILQKANKRIPQVQGDAEYCLPFTKSLRYMIWDYPDKILNQIKTFTKPYDGALTYTAKGEKIIVWSAKKISTRDSLKPPGWFELQKDDCILVQTNTTPILITDYSLITDKIRNSGRFISGPQSI